MSVKFEVVPSLSACEALNSEWEELLRACPQATVFDSVGWIKANVLAFQNPASQNDLLNNALLNNASLKNDTWILAFRAPDSSLAGLIPLVVRRGRRYLRERRWVEFAGQPYADYGSCLVRPGLEGPVAESLLEFCRSKAAAWDGVYLDRLRADDPLLGHVSVASKKSGLATSVRESGHIRRLTTQEFTRGSTGHSSKSLRKARSRLSEQGEIGFEVFARGQPIVERLEVFLAWHVERFASKGLRSPLADPQHRAFYRHIVEELAPQERLWLSVLTCAGRPVAMRFSPVFNGTLHLYSTCFDEAFAKFSPSMLHLEMLLEHAFRSGITCVDFGLGESPQKEFAGASAAQTLVTFEILRGRMASFESRTYQAVERMRSRSQLVARTGKLLRRVFPYDVR
jgi:CelD/BcsL family acetyltransferase involved in cellulose biosynthesis